MLLLKRAIIDSTCVQSPFLHIHTLCIYGVKTVICIWKQKKPFSFLMNIVWTISNEDKKVLFQKVLFFSQGQTKCLQVCLLTNMEINKTRLVLLLFRVTIGAKKMETQIFEILNALCVFSLS